ncbi:MAG: nucleotidyltransferase family protein [Dehalococcoidia bacterium]|nr:nucleotidyltransferase family protein [Dehalococcoidia bacterium]
MKKRAQIIAILASNKPDIMQRFNVKRIGLFGSYARNEQGTASDVDILVDFDPSIGWDFVALAEATERLLGLPVHIVSRRAISPYHMKGIRRDLVYV